MVLPEFGRDKDLNARRGLDHGDGSDDLRFVHGAVWGPDFKRGKVVKDDHRTIDMTPTIAHLFGAKAKFSKARSCGRPSAGRFARAPASRSRAAAPVGGARRAPPRGRRGGRVRPWAGRDAGCGAGPGGGLPRVSLGHRGDAPGLPAVLRRLPRRDPDAKKKSEAHVPSKRSGRRDERVAPLRDDLAHVRFVNPMDLRVAEDTCGDCHGELVEHLMISLHGTTAAHLSDGYFETGIQPTRESRYAVFPASAPPAPTPSTPWSASCSRRASIRRTTPRTSRRTSRT